MTEIQITLEAFKWACSRFEGFVLVTAPRSHDEKVEALTTLRESLGVDDEVLKEFTHWADGLLGSEEHTPAMVLAFLLGVIATDRQYELGPK